MSTFGERIMEARLDKDMSQSQLTRALGLSSSSTVFNWEHDISMPRNLETRKKIAGVLGVTEKWLSTGLGEKSAEKSEEKAMQIKAEQKLKTTVIVNGKDKRKLEDINLAINHIRDMNISVDEMKAIYLTLVEIRTEVECRVLFNGMTA